MNDQYILVDGQPKQCDDMEWGEWMEKKDVRRIGKDIIRDVSVSTVFLGIDHKFGGGPPLLFETMVFGGEFDQEQERYSTIEDAKAGHARWLAKVLGSIQA